MRKFSALLLAAGRGERLRPLTDAWPKCLMPISGTPLLEYWLGMIHDERIPDVYVNTHYLADIVNEFLDRPRFRSWVTRLYEPQLRGTAGSLISNYPILKGKTVLLIHADNWCPCNLRDFIEFHLYRRPKRCPVTMMTFETDSPAECGVVQLGRDGVVQSFYEKVENAPSNLANGAVYILEPEVLDFLASEADAKDFSVEVIPHFLGRIATWKNNGIHRDIGSVNNLRQAQFDEVISTPWPSKDAWQICFESHPVHQALGVLSD